MPKVESDGRVHVRDVQQTRVPPTRTVPSRSWFSAKGSAAGIVKVIERFGVTRRSGAGGKTLYSIPFRVRRERRDSQHLSQFFRLAEGCVSAAPSRA